MTVSIEPMPLAWRAIPRRWWPRHPPPFPDGPPTAEELELARELYLALDEVSQAWYAALRPRLGLPPMED